MISPYVSTYATFCVFCIIILLILLSQTGYSFGDERDVIYFRMLAISIIIQTASQGIWVFRSEIPIGFNQRAAYHLNLLDLLGMAGSVYWWFLYIFIQGQHKKFIEKKQAQLRAILSQYLFYLWSYLIHFPNSTILCSILTQPTPMYAVRYITYMLSSATAIMRHPSSFPRCEC